MNFSDFNDELRASAAAAAATYTAKHAALFMIISHSLQSNYCLITN
jgi:hypothetical protein